MIIPPQNIKEALLPVFNGPDWHDLEIYINWKLAELRKLNDTASGDDLLKNQGAIRELKDLVDLRDRVKSDHEKRK